MSKFFGTPAKEADNPLPRKLRKSSVVNYLGGIEKDQSLFIIELKTGQFYGALWPWRRNKAKIEIHLGYCSDWMSDEDYQQLSSLVHHCISHQAFEQIDANIGGQIHGISLPSFLQMAEMEKSSFTLRVTSRHRKGALYLSDGNLIAAQMDDLVGRNAAYRIISWDDVSIDIEPQDTSKKDEIKQPLMHVLMESLKLKDEAALPQETAPPIPKGRPKPKRRPADKPAKRLIQLERAPAPKVRPKRLPFLTLVAIGVGIFSILAAFAFGYLYYIDNQRQTDGYEKLEKQVQKAENLEAVLHLYLTFQEKHPHSPYANAVRSKIDEFQRKIEDRDFEKATLDVSGLKLDEHYEAKAIKRYTQFLEKYPNSQKVELINKSIGEIKNLLDKYYYEELKQAARLDLGKRLDTYKHYLEKFPEGRFKNDVKVLIGEMGEKYLSYLKDETVECDQKKQWGPCIEHCDNFIKAFIGLGLAQQGQKLKRQLEDQRDYYQLSKQAAGLGNDYLSIQQLYKTYLDQHQDSYKYEEIEKEMARLNQRITLQQKWLEIRSYAYDPANDLVKRIRKVDQYLKANISSIYSDEAQSLLRELEAQQLMTAKKSQLEARRQDELVRLQRQKEEEQRLQKRVHKLQNDLEAKLKTLPRYHTNSDGTFTDITTGMTWCLLDSYQELGGCITYEAALKYVQNLRHGGHTAWRLPSANELASLYKQAPFFPASGAQWYWSVETAVKGYHTVADVVTAEPAAVFQREQRPLTECGSARAILAVQP